MRKKQMKMAQHGGQSRVLAMVVHRGMSKILWFIATLGALFMLPMLQMGGYQASAAVLNIGYSPASEQTAQLPQSQIIHHDKNFVKNLKANTPFVRCTNRRELPEQSGNQHRLYMYETLGANTNQQAEGTVGSGIAVQVLNNTSTIGNYADYVNISHFARVTTIDPALENIQKELAYRLGLTLSTIARNTADGAQTVDASVANQNVAFNALFSRSTVVSAVASMTGRNVQAFDAGKMCGVIHPFIVGDALNDTSNNSIVDILKRQASGLGKLSELPAPDGDEVPVMEWGGVDFYQSTMVTQTPNYQGHGGTALRTYIFGENGVISISLGQKEGSKIGDGDYRNLKLWMVKLDEPTGSDPSRVIGGFTSYNVYYTATLPPDTTQRIRTTDAQSAIA